MAFLESSMLGFQSLFWAMNWEVRTNDQVNLIFKSVVHQDGRQCNSQRDVLINHKMFFSYFSDSWGLKWLGPGMLYILLSRTVYVMKNFLCTSWLPNSPMYIHEVERKSLLIILFNFYFYPRTNFTLKINQSIIYKVLVYVVFQEFNYFVNQGNI